MESSVFVDGGWYDGDLEYSPPQLQHGLPRGSAIPSRSPSGASLEYSQPVLLFPALEPFLFPSPFLPLSPPLVSAVKTSDPSQISNHLCALRPFLHL